jgi:pyruvyltransferase
MKEVKIWRWELGGGLTNFGDEISKYIISKKFGVQVKVEGNPMWADMAAAGSIIDLLIDFHTKDYLVVWGAGFIKEGPERDGNRYKYIAARGKQTAKRLSGFSGPLGDPGLLADCLLDEQPEKEYRFGLFPHYVDANHPLVREAMDRPDIALFSAHDNPVKTVREMAKCEQIVSSSLHGLIVADALGIPNARIKLSDELTGGDYKFLDYYSVFGIDQIPCVDVDTGVGEWVLPGDYDRPGLSEIQQGLVEVFPYGS